MAERPVLCVAVDPGRSSGIAMATQCGDDWITTVDGGMSPPSRGCDYAPLVEASKLGYRVMAIIERSTVNHARFAAHRADANKWAGYLKVMFPRRNKIEFVDPRTWQRQLLGDPKNRILTYEQYAERFLDHSGTSDEAAALCLMEYARKCLWR